MSKAKTRWKRLFGLPLRRWAGRDPGRRPLPDDCDTVITDFTLKEADVKNAPRARRALESDGRFHHWEVILPDGTVVQATHQTSRDWIVEKVRDENRERSRANLRVGDQVLETIVTKPQRSGAPFVPEVWVVPVAPPRPRPSTPLREARRRPDLSRLECEARAVVRSDREIYCDLGSYLCGEVRRIIAAAKSPIGRDDIAAALQLSLSGEEGRALVTALHHLRDEGAIIDEPGDGKGRLYRIASTAKARGTVAAK